MSDGTAPPAAPQSDPLGGGKSPQDQFMDVVEKAQTDLPDEPYMKRAFFVLHRDSFPRKQCIQIMENPWFDRSVLVLILLNCLTMLIFDDPVVLAQYGDNLSSYMIAVSKSKNAANYPYSAVQQPFNTECVVGKFPPCNAIDVIELFYLMMFSIEMIIKLVALGLVSYKSAYLRSGWNVLDVVVVFTGWATLLIDADVNLSILRSFKVLRPLRSMNKVRGMRVLVQSIMSAIPQLCNVVAFLVFYLIVAGIIGVTLFMSTMRHSCFVSDGEGGWESTGWICDPLCKYDPLSTKVIPGSCRSLGENTLGLRYGGHTDDKGVAVNGWGGYTCAPGERCLCGEFGMDAADPENCDIRDNPNYGVNNFDNIFWASVTIFQSITLEGWVDVMYQVMDGYQLWSCFFFIFIVILGAYIIINLFLAVLCDNFNLADSDGPPEERVDSEQVVLRAARNLNHSNPIRAACLKLTLSTRFNQLVVSIIILNTVLMASQYYPQDPDPALREFDYLDPGLFFFFLAMNWILSAFFVFESTVKMLGLGPSIFKRDNWNNFDLIVVLFSVIEITLDGLRMVNVIETKLPGLQALRAFRLLRLLKLVRFVASLRAILKTLFTSLQSVSYLAMLLILFVIIFSLVGMQFFGGRFPRPEYQYTRDLFPKTFASRPVWWDEMGEDRGPDLNFDSIGDAALTIFVVLSGENWNDIYFNHHRASFDDYGIVATIYFLLLFIFGNLLLFNLFIAILLSNFDDEEEEEEEEELEEEDDDDLADDAVTAKPAKPAGSIGGKVDDPVLMEYAFGSYREKNEADKRKSGGAGLKRTDAAAGMTAIDTSGEDLDETTPNPEVNKLPPVNDEYGDKSLCIFPWSSPVRRTLARIIWHPYFDPTIIFLILLSSVALAMDWPAYDRVDPTYQFLKACDAVFTTIFTIECLMKVIVLGLIKSKRPDLPAYLRVGWNCLDFVIVIISLVTQLGSAIPAISRLAFLRALRTLRALRPLRLISRFESLKQVVDTLLKSVPAMASLMTVATLFFTIFGILGMTLFGGKFGECVDPLGDGIVPGYTTVNGVYQSDYDECMAIPKYNLTRHNSKGELLSEKGEEYRIYYEFPQWLLPGFGNFDNIFYSILLLFEVAALEGWPDVMAWAMGADGAEPYIQPDMVSTSNQWEGYPIQEHYSMAHMGAVFFVMWIIFGCFVVMNMTIGVVVDTFAKIREENNGCALMTDEQSEWVQAQKRVIAMRPRREATPPTEPWRMSFFDVVSSPKFDVLIMSVIMINLVHMASNIHAPEWEGLTEFNSALDVANYIFFGIYLIEMGAKMLGLGLAQYFSDPWNQFDFLLVVLQGVDILINSLGAQMPFPPMILRVLRLFRVVRILRILKTAKSIRTILVTIYISLPALSNIVVLILLLLFIYSVLAVNLFYAVFHTSTNFTPGSTIMAGKYYYPDDDYADYGTNYGDFIHRHANFHGLGRSVLTLWRCATGESFNGLMHDLMDGTWGHNRLRCCPSCGPLQQVSEPFNTETLEGFEAMDSCGSSVSAVVLFISFTLFMTYIVLSLAIGVILENFANVGSDNKAITMEQLEEFREVWLKYDPRGTFIVPSHNLLAILQQLHYPLGIHGKTPAFSRAQMLQFLGELDIPDHGGYIHFMETLTAISHKVCGVPVPMCPTTLRIQRSVQKVPNINKLERPAHNALTNYLVSLLQSRWRGYAMRKKYSDHPLPAGNEGGAPPAESADGSKVKSNQVAPAPPDS